MASPSLMRLPILLLLFLSVLIEESQQSCPESFYFNCPDNVHNGEFPYSHFTNTSLHQYCGAPCELTCDYNNHTMIKCNESSPYPLYQVLNINPIELTIAVDYPAGLDLEDPCYVYSVLNVSFPSFRFVNLTKSGENETLLGCPYTGDGTDDSKVIRYCREDDHNVAIRYTHGQLPAGKPPPAGCIQFPGAILERGFWATNSQFPVYNAAQPPSTGHPGHSDAKGGKGILGPALEIALPSACILACLIIGICFCLRRKRKNSPGNRNVEAFLKIYGTSAPQRYTYSAIKKMTSSFKEKVGQGGFGAVYKGRLVDGRVVAVKLLKQSKRDSGEEFINEVASIGRTNHINIVTLLGFCFQRHKRALVYEFMPNGSLDKFTKHHDGGSQPLTWQTMLDISLGIARGLEYLHRGCQTRILHLDIKPHNILLDENFCPKISDFGLAKLYPQDKDSKVSMSEARGTIGYIAPEVFCRGFGQVCHKADVYSYGMMVLEVIGGRRRASDGADTSSSDLCFARWVYEQLERGEEVDDDEVAGDEDKEVKRKLILVSIWCIQTVPSSRPSISRVVQMLEAKLDACVEIPPMPTLYSPPRSNVYPSGSQSFAITL